MRNLLADIKIGTGPLQGVGPLGTGITDATAPTLFNNALSLIIGVMTVVAFIWFTFQVILGAIRIIGSGGDKNAIEGARKQITTGIVGVVVVVAALFLVSLIGTLLGVNNILNPTCIIAGNC